MPPTPPPSLSPREHQICVLVAAGKTNKSIAAALKLGPATVKDHLRRIFLKTSCQSRTELAVQYVQGASGKPIRAKQLSRPRL